MNIKCVDYNSNVNVAKPAVVRECEALIEKLVNVPTPGTYEDAGQKIVANYLSSYCDAVNTDVHGNVLGVINPAAATKLLLTAHIDEIAMMVTHIDESGFLSIAPVGGSRPDALVGQRVSVHSSKGPVPGVIGRKPGTAPKGEIEFCELRIDIGTTGRQESTALVSPGDTATVISGFERLASDSVTGRGLDDRAGVAAMLAAMKIIASQRSRLNVGVYALSATQEEGGQHRGALTGTFALQPQACLAIDVGYATDCPQSDKQKNAGSVYLRGGPMLSISLTTSRVVNRLVRTVAAEHKIPLQVSVEPRLTGTDGDVIASTGKGVATGVISIPCRYMHSPSEIVALSDVAMTAELVAAFALALPQNPDFRPFPTLNEKPID